LDQANPDSKNEIFQFEDPNKFNLYQNSKGRVFAGTPPWMAPEQFEGYSDIRTDIYSFGIVLFQIENHGNLPFIANTIIGFERAHHHNQVPYFESKLNSIIEKCLKKSPKDRYQNFTELRLELEEIHRKEIGENLPSIPNQKAMEYIDHHSKGYSLIRLGYNEDALDNLKKAFELNKKDFSIYINLSGAYIRNRLFEEAIVILREAINKFPPDPDFYLNLYDAYHKRAIMLDDLSQMKESKKCLDKAMKISPNNLHVLLRMVVYYVYYELNYQKALKFAKKAQKLYPNTSSVLTHLAAVYYQLNKYDESIKWYTEAIKINPNLFALDYFHLGRAYFKKNMIKQASSMFQRGLSIDPQDPEIHYYLGRFYFIQSRDLALAEKKIGKRNIELLEMAINEFKTALKIYPNYVDAQKQLSACTETRDLVKNYL
jgi:tetratricopeptide (TPR) repeat protein